MKRTAKLRRRRALRRTGALKRVEFARQAREHASRGNFRRAVRTRADGLCEASTPACPPHAHRGEHAHHLRLRSQGGSDASSNGLYVCALAHEYIHSHPAESYERGWLRRSEAS